MSDKASSLRIGKAAFILAFCILTGLMIFSGILTRTVPAGTFERELVDGREFVIPGSYQLTPEQAPPAIWRWFTAPVEVLFAPGAIVAVTIIVFLIFVGGSFTILEQSGVLEAFVQIAACHRRRGEPSLVRAVAREALRYADQADDPCAARRLIEAGIPFCDEPSADSSSVRTQVAHDGREREAGVG